MTADGPIPRPPAPARANGPSNGALASFGQPVGEHVVARCGHRVRTVVSMGVRSNADASVASFSARPSCRAARHPRRGRGAGADRHLVRADGAGVHEPMARGLRVAWRWTVRRPALTGRPSATRSRCEGPVTWGRWRATSMPASRAGRAGRATRRSGVVATRSVGAEELARDRCWPDRPSEGRDDRRARAGARRGAGTGSAVASQPGAARDRARLR